MEEKNEELEAFNTSYEKCVRMMSELFILQKELEAMSLLLKDSMGEDLFLKHIDTLAKSIEKEEKNETVA